MDKAQIKELKIKLGLAKTKPLKFAFAPGKTADDCACELHPKAELLKLRKQVKADAGVTDNKVLICGMANVDGPLLIITCEDEPKRPSIKMLRKFLKAGKLALKVRILDTNGKVLDDEDEEEPLDGADQSTAPQTEDAEEETAPVSAESDDLQMAFDILSRKVHEVADRNPDRSEALLSAVRTVGGLIEAGDSEKARAGMARLAAALKKQGSSAGKGNPDAKAVSASFKKLLQLRSETDASYTKLMAAIAQQPDPRVNRIAKDDFDSIFGGTKALLDGIEADLLTAATVWNKSQGEDRKAAEAEIRHCIKQLRGHLSGNELIALLEQNPFGTTLKINAPLVAILDEIDAQLAA